MTRGNTVWVGLDCKYNGRTRVSFLDLKSLRPRLDLRWMVKKCFSGDGTNMVAVLLNFERYLYATPTSTTTYNRTENGIHPKNSLHVLFFLSFHIILFRPIFKRSAPLSSSYLLHWRPSFWDSFLVKMNLEFFLKRHITRNIEKRVEGFRRNHFYSNNPKNKRYRVTWLSRSSPFVQ